MLNLVGVIGDADKQVVQDYLQSYRPGTQHPALDALIGHALAYHRDYVAPTLERRTPTAEEAAALRDLDARLAALAGSDDLAAAAQNEVYEVGKALSETGILVVEDDPAIRRLVRMVLQRRGDVVETASLWGEWYEKPEGRWPGEVGPIAVEGAEPGDTLVVEILKVRPNRDSAVSTQGGRFGALVPDQGTASLNDAFPCAK